VTPAVIFFGGILDKVYKGRRKMTGLNYMIYLSVLENANYETEREDSPSYLPETGWSLICKPLSGI
jgi:hypothetical protein